MEYLVTYYNGRNHREKLFATREEAVKFLENCKDTQAKLYKREEP